MKNQISYNLIRSKRKTISVEIANDGSILVRAPRWSPKWEIDNFVLANQDWIEEHQALTAINYIEEAWTPKLTDREIKKLKEEARDDISTRIGRWAPIVAPESAWVRQAAVPRLTIGRQKTLWGSCTPEGNLSFNCLLMLTPEDVRDYVVVHELCHLKHMDHSREFWRAVERALPNYRIQKKWLKENGRMILARLY